MNLTAERESQRVCEPSFSDDKCRFYHVPVLIGEVMSALRPAPGKIFLDGTLGGGGHSQALLEAGAQVIALDQDEDALLAARKKLARFGDALHFVKANFRDLDQVLESLEIQTVDGMLLDVGVSSHQLDVAERGFSFQSAGPLDMRMDRSRGMTAAEWVNTVETGELTRVFSEYGEESNASRIARKIASRREIRPFVETSDLAAVVEEMVPRRGRRHPATQIFQALRIAVNDELGALAAILDKAPQRLASGARFAVITFHSLEDRLVKSDFRKRSQEWLDRPEWPAARPNPDCVYRLLTRKSIKPGQLELSANPRSRSARLRVIEKL